jgi:CDP-diglyceride synthetase
MSTADILTAIQDSPIAHAISKSNHLVAAGLQVVHVLGFIALLAALVLVSLRILKLVLNQQPLSEVTRDANRLFYLGLSLTVCSGVLMFVSSPKLYFYKYAFELKMLLFVAAIVIQFAVLRRVAANENPKPFAARAAVALSLTAWFGIGLAGRMIGFT